MSRISNRQLYDNRDILTQILNLKDEIADQAIENIAFARSGSVVTLTVTLGDGTIKTANFTEKTISTITSSQVGDVVTLNFNFNDGTTQIVAFHVSGGGAAPSYTAGNGITKTGTASEGYTFAIDTSVTATKTSVDDAVTRITQCENDLLVLGPRVDSLDADVGVLVGKVNTAERDITTINSTIGTDTTPGTLKGRTAALEDAMPGIDIAAFSDDNTHVPSSKLVNDKKLDKPGTTPTVGQLLAAGATGTEWVNPTPGAVIDTAMSDTSENAVQNKVIKGYVDNVDARVDTLEDELGDEATSGTINFKIKKNADDIDALETVIGDNTGTPKTGMWKVIDDNDQAAVHKTGDETIDGNKIFERTVVCSRSGSTPEGLNNNAFNKKMSEYDATNIPTANMLTTVVSCTDMNDVYWMRFRLTKEATTGKTKLYAQLLNSDGATQKFIILAESD